MHPKVSLIWLNYNSSKFIELALKSLKSLFELNYSNYEVIVVDNCSTDGSFEIIKSFLEKAKSDVRVKLIRTDRNLGYTGGNNVGFRARDKDSEYVVLVNNDFIMHPDSLEVVEHMHGEDSVGAAQGITLNPRGALESFGIILDEMLAGHGLSSGTSPQSIKRPLTVTYVLGACAFYRVRAAREAWGGRDRLFFDWAFGYFDDVVLCLQLWNAGWKCRAYPIITGRHFQSRSFGSTPKNPFKIYLLVRNLLVLAGVTNSRYKHLIPLLAARAAATMLKFNFTDTLLSRYVLKAFHDARNAVAALTRAGFLIDLYRAPVIKLDLIDALQLITARRKTVIDKINERITRFYFGRTSASLAALGGTR